LGLPFRLYPQGFTGWADDTIEKMGVHSTTHIDAPWHYGPTCEGKPAKTIDIYQWGWDLPLPHLIRRAKETNDSELFWEAHLVGRDREYCHLEQLTNLDALPITGFTVAVFPLKIVGASAAPARVVAMIDE
jgi:kynurenine formamidase